MVKVIAGSILVVGVLSFVACNGGDPKPPSGGTLADCPAKIAVVGFAYSVPACQLKVGSSVTIEASTDHPVVAKGGTPLVTDTKTTEFTFKAVAADVDKTFEYQCLKHGPSMSGSIKVVAAM